MAIEVKVYEEGGDRTYNVCADCRPPWAAPHQKAVKERQAQRDQEHRFEDEEQCKDAACALSKQQRDANHYEPHSKRRNPTRLQHVTVRRILPQVTLIYILGKDAGDDVVVRRQ